MYNLRGKNVLPLPNMNSTKYFLKCFSYYSAKHKTNYAFLLVKIIFYFFSVNFWYHVEVLFLKTMKDKSYWLH